MPSFLERMRSLDTATPQPARPQLEPRRVRREKLKAAAKAVQEVGATTASVSSSPKKKIR